MKDFKFLAVLIGTCAAFASPTNAQPPDVVNSDMNANTAMGTDALLPNQSSAFFNTAAGYQALDANMTGSGNSAFGYQTLYSNTSGTDNAAFGVGALGANTSGGLN